MNDILLTPIRLNELETLIQNSVRKVIRETPQGSQPRPETELITRQQTADILGVSLPTLTSWVKRGVLPAHRIANRVRFKKNEVLASLKKVQTIKYNRGQ